MKKEYTAQSIICNSRFIGIWQNESDEFKAWTLNRVQELIRENPDHCAKVTFTHRHTLPRLRAMRFPLLLG